MFITLLMIQTEKIREVEKAQMSDIVALFALYLYCVSFFISFFTSFSFQIPLSFEPCFISSSFQAPIIFHSMLPLFRFCSDLHYVCFFFRSFVSGLSLPFSAHHHLHLSVYLCTLSFASSFFCPSISFLQQFSLKHSSLEQVCLTMTDTIVL